MKQEERKILLAELSARLPYGVKCKIDGLETPVKLTGIEIETKDNVFLDFAHQNGNLQVYLSEAKPYLRPIFSMTEKEKIEYKEAIDSLLWTNELKFFNKYHFDYLDLISKGLAIEVTEENNPYKETTKDIKLNVTIGFTYDNEKYTEEELNALAREITQNALAMALDNELFVNQTTPQDTEWRNFHVD